MDGAAGWDQFREITLPLLRPMQKDMVMLQLETGMRPGELVAMRACEIDMIGTIWFYRCTTHKTIHNGHERIIAIGPKGRASLAQYSSVPPGNAGLF